MADIGRTAPLSQTPGWTETSQALNKLQGHGDQHLRTEAGQKELHLHDSDKWHGIGSPKAKYKEAVLLIKASIDKDFGPGSGDLVFRNIGIKKNSEGLKFKQIAALRQEVGNLQRIDQSAARQKLDGINAPSLKPVDVQIKDGKVTVSGQMLRDLQAGFKVNIGGSGSTNDANLVVTRLHVITGRDPGHLLALSKALSQMTPGLLKGADPMLKTLVTDDPKGAVSFNLDSTSDGYSLDVEYTAPVKAKGKGMDAELCDPQSSQVTVKATLHIPFAGIDNQGNIDPSQIGFDGQKPPRYDLTFNPI